MNLVILKNPVFRSLSSMGEGKTRLINNFIKDKPGMYFMADKRGTNANLIRFRTKRFFR